MFWVLFPELLNIVPEGWNGADVLGQRDREPVLEVLSFHDEKRIKVEITRERDARLNAPVVVELLNEFVSEKESRFVATHVPVRLTPTVGHFARLHVLAVDGCLCLVDESWVAPMFLWDEPCSKQKVQFDSQ